MFDILKTFSEKCYEVLKKIRVPNPDPRLSPHTHPYSLTLTYNLNQTFLLMYCRAPPIDNSCITNYYVYNLTTFLKRFKT